jgi:hypothetical protein
MLVRPCEKLWRTVSRSTPPPRFSPKVRLGATLIVLSPGLLVSLIRL